VSKQIDDLEAVRVLAQTLEPFKGEERERIIRWAKERLGMEVVNPAVQTPAGSQPIPTPIVNKPGSQKDIKTFIDEKDPASDQQLAAVVAYYYQFESQEKERKETIGSQELLDACRLAKRNRPGNPGQTLRNAARSGILDHAGDQGQFQLNAVGENLVAMVLPEKNGKTKGNKKSTTKTKRGKAKKAKTKKAKNKKKKR